MKTEDFIKIPATMDTSIPGLKNPYDREIKPTNVVPIYKKDKVEPRRG